MPPKGKKPAKGKAPAADGPVGQERVKLEPKPVPGEVASRTSHPETPLCLDGLLPKWDAEAVENGSWGAAEGQELYEEELPKLPVHLACIVAEWKRPLEYIKQPPPKVS